METCSTLREIFSYHKGKLCFKWEFYVNNWDSLLEIKKSEPINLLEIGVQDGGSLEIWAKYFTNAQSIIGIDVNPKCANLIYDDPRIHFVLGDANVSDTFQQVTGIVDTFDIVIDDGSHISKDIIKSFFLYFEVLREGGIYIIEDLHASYWDEYEGGLYHPGSSISFFKKLVDIINNEHWRVSQTVEEFLHDFEKYTENGINEEVLRKIQSIQFLNSMVVIKKSSQEETSLGKPMLSGLEENISESIEAVNSSAFENYLKNMTDNSNDLDTFALQQANETLQTKIQTLQGQKDELFDTIQQIKNSTSWKITQPIRTVKNIILKIQGKL